MMGAKAAELLIAGESNRLVAFQDGKFVDYDIQEALQMTKTIPEDQYNTFKNLVR
jgi:6-phosphofructokinase 1